jgi:hypothetical protein
MSRNLLIGALLVLLPGLAAAEPKLYGVAAGTAFDLEPAEKVGVSVAASVTIPAGEGWGSPLRARGRLLGLLTDSGWAVVPSLSGVIAAELGPIELSLDAGVNIFGVAHQGEETIFSIFGFRAGGGLMIVPQPTWRIGVRGDLSWLPRKLSSPIEEPQKDAVNDYVYVSLLLTVEFLTDLGP